MDTRASRLSSIENSRTGLNLYPPLLRDLRQAACRRENLVYVKHFWLLIFLRFFTSVPPSPLIVFPVPQSLIVKGKISSLIHTCSLLLRSKKNLHIVSHDLESELLADRLASRLLSPPPSIAAKRGIAFLTNPSQSYLVRIDVVTDG